MEKFTHLDLFSGIGGFALAAQTVWGKEYECLGFVEIDKFCQAVLQKNFPGVRIYGDIRKLTGKQLQNDAAQNSVGVRRILGEAGEEGTDIRQQRESGAGDGNGLHLQSNPDGQQADSDAAGQGLEGQTGQVIQGRGERSASEVGGFASDTTSERLGGRSENGGGQRAGVYWQDVPQAERIGREELASDTESRQSRQPSEPERRTDSGGTNFSIDLLTGGFPCQPFSTAGKRKGTEDDRFLWPAMFRIISETRPRWVVGENVAGIITLALDQVVAELEGLDYDVQCFVIPACAVDAPHRRDRVWIIAHDKNAVGTGARSEQRQAGDEGRIASESGRTGLRQEHGQAGAGGVDATGADAASDTASDRRFWRGQGTETEEGLQSGSQPSRELESRFEGCDCSSSDADWSGSGASERRTDGNEQAVVEEWNQPQFESCRQCDVVADSTHLFSNGSNGDARECERQQEVPQSGNSRGETSASDTSSKRLEREQDARDAESRGETAEQRLGEFPEGRTFPDWSRDWREVALESCVRGVDDGLPKRVARLPDGSEISESKWRQEALKAYGNSIVPEVAMEIFRAIKAIEDGQAEQS